MKAMLLTIAALWATSVSAATIYVSKDGSHTAPYSSPAAAARDVQSAIDAAANGDTVRVTAGRYRGGIDFRGKAIAVRGAGPRTIIESRNGESVVKFTNGEGRGSVLDSVLITGGDTEDGGGILVVDSAPNLQRLVIFNNQASGSGAGILVRGTRSGPLVRNCIIAWNYDSSPATTDAHQIFIDSGASARVFNNTIARGNGNGILLLTSRRPSVIENNVIAWNGSRLPGGATIGRGICDFSGSARIRFNLFHRNMRAALLTDVPGGGFQDIASAREAEIILQRSRVANNLDGDPGFRGRLSRSVPRNFPVASLFRPRASSRLIRVGNPASAFRNANGSRNTLGHTGGPLGWR